MARCCGSGSMFPSPSCPPKPAFGRRRMRGGVRGGGNHARSSLLRPPSPTLPRKGGGSGETGRAARSIIARNLRSPAPCHVAGACSALRAIAAKLIQPVIKIDAVAAEAALGQNSRNLRRLLAGTEAVGIHDHARQSR